MKGYATEKVRNVALLGHNGSGKTTFLEAALLNAKVISRLGKVEDGNTVSDYEKMEQQKHHTINTTLVPVEYNGVKINVLDTPGIFDYVGEARSALSVADAAVIMVDASAGVQVGTEKAWDLCHEFHTPFFFLVNKLDKEGTDFNKTVEELRERFGNKCVSDHDEDAINETVAMANDDLMEKFFAGEAFTEEEFSYGLTSGIRQGDVIPIIPASNFTGEGIDEMLGCFAKYIGNPMDSELHNTVDGEEFNGNPDGDPVLFVFKTLADPFLGKISYARVLSGTVKVGAELYNPRKEKFEKLGSLFFMRGKSQVAADSVNCGDIVAIGKLQFTSTGDTLCKKSSLVQIEPIHFPKPGHFIAIAPEDKNDEEKMAQGFGKLIEEDPSFVLQRNSETHQTLLGGQGEIQLATAIAKLQDRYGVKIKIVPQKIAYRETIKGSSDVQGKHKKQSGGAGQYGDVHIRFSPSKESGLEFSEELFGGSVPKNYVPAVEKGLLECMDKGPLAGCKVQNIKAVLYDGSYHDVDSNEVSFKIAASLAFKKGIQEAKPCLLEPIMKVDITVPERYTGDVMGDINKRRGKILGMDPCDAGTTLHAEIPQSELFDYAVVLRAMTQARGTFELEIARYEELPGQLAEKVISAYKAEHEA